MRARSFRLRPDAETEANEAFEWYESERPGLGNEFRDELKLLFKRIDSSPDQFPVAYGLDTRRAHLRRFPYSIIFKVSVNEILIVAIFHDRRNPIIWRGRID